MVLGCAWLGAIAVPINVASRGPQLQHILSNCQARLLVMEAAYAEKSRLAGATRPCHRGDLADRAPGGRPGLGEVAAVSHSRRGAS